MRKKVLLAVAVVGCGAMMMGTSACKKKSDDPKTYICTCGSESVPVSGEDNKNSKEKEDCRNASVGLQKEAGKWACTEKK